MANGQGNLLTAPLTTIKQMGEQTSAAIASIGTGLTNAASQGIDTLLGGMPGLPGVPGANAGTKGLPTPQQLLPANLTQALGQVENLILPKGLPRPSQAFKTTPTPTPTPTPAAAAAEAATSEASGAQPMRRRIMERRGL